MNPSDLRDRLTIQHRKDGEPTSDTAGRPSSGPEAQWEDVATVRGDVRQSGGSKSERGSRETEDQSVTVHLRDHPLVSENMRLIWHSRQGDRTLRVQNVVISGEMEQGRTVNAVYSGD